MANTNRRAGRCAVCYHDERSRIEFLLANKAKLVDITAEFGMHRTSIWRHWRRHVSDTRKVSLVTAGLPRDSKIDLETLKRNEGESLLHNLLAERARLTRIADLCELTGNHKDSVAASTAIVRTIELGAKYIGQLRVGNTTITNNVSFLLSPDWVSLRAAIVTALRPFPDAQRAVIEAVGQHEATRGIEINRHHVRELPALEQSSP